MYALTVDSTIKGLPLNSNFALYSKSLMNDTSVHLPEQV